MVTHDLQNALREGKSILHIGQKRWFYGSVAEFLRSDAGKRFGGDAQ